MIDLTNLLFLLALLLPAHGKIEVTREQNQLRMSSDKCAEVQESVAALNKWTLSTGGRGQCQSSAGGTGACSVDITSCVPAHVAKYQGVKPDVAGPNCWNLALVMKGILPNLRHTSSEEMAFYMKPPLCRELKNSEPREPGDVGAIRGKGKKETHGFIYISDSLVYSKDGETKDEPYALESLDEVLTGYGVPNDPNCRKNQISSKAACAQAVATFRCQSMSSYLEKNPDIPKEMKKALDGVGDYEQCLEKATFGGAPMTAKHRENLIDAGRALFAYLDQSEKKAKSELSDEKKKFLLGSLRLRLESIVVHVSWGNGSLHERAESYGTIQAMIRRLNKSLGETKSL